MSDLVTRGLAQCVLGNHELNLLRQERKECIGWHFEDNHDHREGKFTTARHLGPEERPALQSFLESLPLLRNVAALAAITRPGSSVLPLRRNPRPTRPRRCPC
jgi:hypothetical protein